MDPRAPPSDDNPWMDESTDGDYEPVTETDGTDSDGERFEEALEQALESGMIEEDADDLEDDEDDDEEGETDFDDATENLLEILEEGEEVVDDNDDAEAQPNGGASGQAAATEEQPTQRIAVTRNQLLQLFSQNRSFRALFQNHGGGGILGEDDDDDSYGRVRRRNKRRRSDLYPKIPSEKGQELMDSGVFGVNERDMGTYTRKKKMATRIMRRELGLGSPGHQRACDRLVSQSLIPQSKPDSTIHVDERCYSGQFSDDGNFFFSCSQDFCVRMYDTSNPFNWRYYKTVHYPYGQWTITDASLSPDNKFLAYSSIRPAVCLANTDPEPSAPYQLDFSDMGGGRRGGGHYRGGHFGIWSLRFSGDGREIVAGTSDRSVYVFDLERRQSVLRIPGHEDDVNAVCFGDKSSPHLLYSGSDDSTLKVWDRRSLGDNREAGVFVGHTEGLTYVDSKGDGRYVLSNAKDQTMKLWDLRKMVSKEDFSAMVANNYSSGFDYRVQPWDEEEYTPHPNDGSIVTFRGHQVLKTLIRCHFSPPGSTDSRYVYTGSADGSVWIYNMDATVAGKLEVEKHTEGSTPRTGDDDDMFGMYQHRRGGAPWKTCVRDVAWHPNAPVIAATSWNGYGSRQGTCTVHTWNDGVEEDEGEPAIGNNLDCELGPHRPFNEEPPPEMSRQRMRSRLMRDR